MRVVMVLRDEFKRSSWIFIIILACFFLSAVDFSRTINNIWLEVSTGGAGWYTFEGIYNGFTHVYLIPIVLLALCQSRKKTDNFWSSLPYTAGELYVFRLLYGAVIILLMAVFQLVMTAVVLDRYDFFIRDCQLLGISTDNLYRLGEMVTALFGAYIIATLVYMLVNNRFAASLMLFFLALIPELLFVPLDWFGISTDAVQAISNIKYAVVFGIYSPYIIREVYTVGVPVYAGLVVVVFLSGYFVSRKNSQEGNNSMFVNGFVKAVFILLSILVVLNIIDGIFLQGGV